MNVAGVDRGDGSLESFFSGGAEDSWLRGLVGLDSSGWKLHKLVRQAQSLFQLCQCRLDLQGRDKRTRSASEGCCQERKGQVRGWGCFGKHPSQDRRLTCLDSHALAHLRLWPLGSG